MNDDITKEFFDWLDSEGLKPKDVADDLGNNHLTVSNWRSKGIPKGKQFSARSLIEKSKRQKEAKESTVEVVPQNLVLEFEDSSLFDAICEQTAKDGFTSPRKWAVAALNGIINEDLGAIASNITRMVADGDIKYGERYELPCAAVAAGHPISSDSQEDVKLAKKYGQQYLAFKVYGPSMEPVIDDGSVIVCLKREFFRVQEPKKGMIYVFSLGGELTLKRYNTRPATEEEMLNEEPYIYSSPRDGSSRVKVLESANPDYDEIIVKGETEIVAWYDPKNQP